MNCDTPDDDDSSRYDFFRFGSGDGVNGRSSFSPRKLLEERPRLVTLEDIVLLGSFVVSSATTSAIVSTELSFQAT